MCTTRSTKKTSQQTTLIVSLRTDVGSFANAVAMGTSAATMIAGVVRFSHVASLRSRGSCWPGAGASAPSAGVVASEVLLTAR